jgi:hypothetical protein
MGLIERRSGDKVRGRERSLEIQVGGLGGFEVRPTRFFLWSGGQREGRERVLSLGTRPRSLTLPRRERELRAGSVRVRSLGNPLMTMALAGIHAARKAVKERKD